VSSARYFAVFIALPCVALADADAGVDEAPALDDSSVTSQVASFAVTKLKDSPAVVTVISAQDIKESGARDLVDVLQLVPGMFVGADTQGIIGPGFRGLWGHEGKILLMIDGKEMNELLYATMQLGNEFPVELIERVEVVRGPGSVIYGGIAELSVINVITRGVQGSTDVLVSGSYGQYTEGPTFGNSYARRGGVLSGRYVFDSVPGLSAFVSGSIGQGTRLFTGYDDNSRTMAGGSQLDPAVVQVGLGYRDLQASFLYHRYLTSSIAPAGTTVDDKGNLLPVVPANFESMHAEVIGTFHPTDRVEIIPRFNLSIQRPWSDTNDDDFFYDKTARRLRARLIVRWAPLDQLQLTVGGDGMFDHANLNAPPGKGLQTGFGPAMMDSVIDYQTFGAFLEAYSENPIVNISAGARFDNNSAVGGSLVPRVVLLRSFGPVSLKALVSLAFKWPGIENLNLNNAVRPERTTVFEFEVGVDFAKQARLSLNAFNIGINAPIAYLYDQTAGTEIYKNLGMQGTTGGELALRWKNTWARIDANYSLYVPTVATDIDTYQAPGRTDMFLGAPAHHGVLTGSVRPLKWLSLAPTLLIFGPKLAINSEAGDSAEQIPSQVLANFVVRADDVGVKGLNLSLGLYNLFNTNYAHVQPYNGGNAPIPSLGREVLLRVGYTFEPTYD
jgi:outer membrane receptor for ferrienterochelin and colicins